MTLLASSRTFEGIKKLVTEYFGGQEIYFLDSVEKEWHLQRASDGQYLSGLVIYKSKGRYRFEHEPPATT